MNSLDEASAAVDRAFAERGNRRDAEFLLREMDRSESMAQAYEAVAKERGLRPAACAARKCCLEHRYYENVGVGVEQRHKLRKALEEVAEHGDPSIETVIAAVQSQVGRKADGALLGLSEVG